MANTLVPAPPRPISTIKAEPNSRSRLVRRPGWGEIAMGVLEIILVVFIVVNSGLGISSLFWRPRG